MLGVHFNGGLGNQLFQLAAGETIAAETRRPFCIANSPVSTHTGQNYLTSLMANWTKCPPLPVPYTTFNELSFAKHDWKDLPAGNVCLNGYFQNWRYVPSNFGERLRLPQCAPLDGAFLHIRGGDYVNHWLHDVQLHQKYYRSAIEQFPSGTHFYVFTNDRAYAERIGVLADIRHSYIDADEETSLAQMAACKEGGICANSSFSWWGAYLNPNRTIVMPDKWYNDHTMYIDGYYFPGVRKCSV
jgi:hypothetical protein